MKKLIIEIVVLLLIGGIIFGVYYYIDDFKTSNDTTSSDTFNNEDESSNMDEEEINIEDSLISIDYAGYKGLIESKEDFILVVTMTTCSHCQSYKPVLEEVLSEYNLQAYEIDILTLPEDEMNVFWEELNISGTPTTLFYNNGEELDVSSRIVGDAEKEKIISKLIDNGFINE